jgi:hypothetical protein
LILSRQEQQNLIAAVVSYAFIYNRFTLNLLQSTKVVLWQENVKVVIKFSYEKFLFSTCKKLLAT